MKTTMTRTESIPPLCRTAAAAMLSTLLLFVLSTGLVQAQSADNPPQVQPARTLKPPPRDSKVIRGVERGTDAAGRGIDRADSATRRGINNTSERASRPVRGVGEALGRKLAPGTSGRAAPPPVGPQGNAP